MTRIARMAGARNILTQNGGFECRKELKKFLYGDQYETHVCFVEKIEKRFKNFLLGNKKLEEKKVDDSGSGSENQKENAKKLKGEELMPVLSNLTVVEGVAEMALKGTGKLVSVRGKTLKDGATDIGKSLLGLDSSESMERVKQILTKTISTEDMLLKLEHKVDSEFQKMEQKMDQEFKKMELLIKTSCGGPKPPPSGGPPPSSSGEESGSNEDSSSDNGVDEEE